MHSVPINFGWHARRHSYHVHNSFFWYFCCSFNEVKYNNRNQLWSWNKLLDKTKSDAECSYIGRLSRSLKEKVTNVNCIENNNRIICKWLISMSSTATNLCCVFIRSEICCMHSWMDIIIFWNCTGCFVMCCLHNGRICQNCGLVALCVCQRVSMYPVDLFPMWMQKLCGEGL